MIDKERWKDVCGYEGMYKVSSFGNVVSLDRFGNDGRILKGAAIKPRENKDGYMYLTMYKNGTKKTKRVHKLVAEAFLGESNGLTVNHKDGIKKNNFISNLEYCTFAENQKHAFLIGLKNVKGEKHPVSKLTNKKVLEIKSLAKSGKTQKYIAKKYNICQSAVSRIVSGDRWSHI